MEFRRAPGRLTAEEKLEAITDSVLKEAFNIRLRDFTQNLPWEDPSSIRKNPDEEPAPVPKHFTDFLFGEKPHWTSVWAFPEMFKAESGVQRPSETVQENKVSLPLSPEESDLITFSDSEGDEIHDPEEERDLIIFSDSEGEEMPDPEEESDVSSIINSEGEALPESVEQEDTQPRLQNRSLMTIESCPGCRLSTDGFSWDCWQCKVSWT